MEHSCKVSSQTSEIRENYGQHRSLSVSTRKALGPCSHPSPHNCLYGFATTHHSLSYLYAHATFQGLPWLSNPSVNSSTWTRHVGFKSPMVRTHIDPAAKRLLVRLSDTISLRILSTKSGVGRRTISCARSNWMWYGRVDKPALITGWRRILGIDDTGVCLVACLWYFKSNRPCLNLF